MFSTYNIIAAVLDQRPVVDNHGNGSVVPRFLWYMGGGCIGEPSCWNGAKQAELRDTVPNGVD